MLTKKVQELSLEKFSKYGTYRNMINPDGVCIGDKPVEFFRDLIQYDTHASGTVSFSICRVQKREPVVDVTEYHNYGAEGTMPIDGDILIHVGYATPSGEIDPDTFEIFRIPKGTFFVIRPGVWHHAPFVYNTDYVNTLIVLPERTYVNDCYVVNLNDDQKIKIEL